MKIAVLGWGSLIWNQAELKIIDNKWNKDGPILPIEFARISQDGRLTLVIKPNWKEVTTQYAVSAFEQLNQALENLMVREKTALNRIGYYNFLNNEKHIRPANEVIIPNLKAWRDQTNVDAVIWTDLPPNFYDLRRLTFDLGNVDGFLKGLNQEEFALAKEYIANAPEQISTRYRTDIKQLISQTRKFK
jgi:hypothetical protein